MKITKEFIAITLFEKFIKDLSDYLELPIEEVEKMVFTYLSEIHE